MWGIELDRSLDISLKRQIYQRLRDQMINGILKEGSPLPSTRELAQTLAVSRNTVNEAYDMLIAEGYAESRQGAPTRVVGGLILDQAKQSAFQQHQETIPVPSLRADFKTGQPDLRQFPRYAWQRVFQKALGEMPVELLGYGGPQGLVQLREEIAAWLLRSKGLTVDAGDIYITAGATQALHLVADLLHTDHPEMLAEDPCNIEMIQTFIQKGYTVTPVPVDAHGIQTNALSLDHHGPIYVTPSHQFPLGGILPAARRAELIRFARRCGSYVIEDDYDSEYRYRIGYVLVPRELQSRWRRLRTYTDVQNPPFEQAALAEFLRTRKFDRHIARMKKLYRERRQALLDALADCFGEQWRPWGDAAGLHLAVEFAGMAFDDSFRDHARRSGILTVPVEHHCIRKGRHTDKLLLGYGHLEPGEIRYSVQYLQQFAAEYFKEHARHR
ncbi:PLP-dependent aminotransferase family protein [Paenibacillus sp. AR247]|uniref:aminotransferase-like domain-containing protein n=1 Tax=Paenibacillus sp. AR247 TaxID=1631599 RepID=UPI000CF8701E|nr:PLP-dependent aminotransferase family protein [Paenibacillus sp. AR247]PQP89040.1 GntR family transcriptional regulator [Paenibacillus sp. AR247]